MYLTEYPFKKGETVTKKLGKKIYLFLYKITGYILILYNLNPNLIYKFCQYWTIESTLMDGLMTPPFLRVWIRKQENVFTLFYFLVPQNVNRIF